MIAIWILFGWIFGVAYFWDMLDRPFTWVLIVFEGALLGPLIAACFLLQPPKWMRGKEHP